MTLPNWSFALSVSAMWLPVDLDHLVFAVEALEQRHRHADLRELARVQFDTAAHQQVEELIGTAEFHVGFERDGIVRLRDRIEKLVHRDRRAVA